MNDIQIECETTTTFLGITLDEHLTWQDHCNMVANKIAKNTGVLNRVKNNLPIAALKTLYYSFIFSHLSYGLEVWGAATSNKNFKRIVTTQKKAIRIITKSKWLSHTEPRMKDLGLLRITDQHQLQCLSLIYDMTKGYCNDIFGLIDKQNDQVMAHNLRSVQNRPKNVRYVTRPNLQRKISFPFVASKFWNNTDENIQSSASRRELKGKIRRKLLGTYRKKVPCQNPRCPDQQSHVDCYPR